MNHFWNGNDTERLK